ncbi:hypothetical protein S9a_00001 [Klebsiella phage S9a]|nr:hypothetical protein S9a_00001 [Klebsiella phage S9a]
MPAPLPNEVIRVWAECAGHNAVSNVCKIEHLDAFFYYASHFR